MTRGVQSFIRHSELFKCKNRNKKNNLIVEIRSHKSVTAIKGYKTLSDKSDLELIPETRHVY